MILPGTGRGTGVAGGGVASLAPGSSVLNENGCPMFAVSAADQVKMPVLAVAGMNAMAGSGLTAPLHRFAVPLPVTGEEL